MIAKHVRGGDMRKNKGMLKGERRINRQSLAESQIVRSRWLRVKLRGVESWVERVGELLWVVNY